MKIAVIGAGVVGVATAHALAERGHEVTVYDRRADIASDASASTGGLIAPGHSYAWASPSAPAMLVRSLFGADTSIRVRPRADAALIRWGLRFLRECTPGRSQANTLAKFALAQYSQRLTDEVAAREGIEFCHTDRGVLYLYRDEAELVAAERKSALLREHGRMQKTLGPEEIVAVEPALAHGRNRFAGAIHDTTDASGDPQRFAAGLAESCRRLGVQFRLGTDITGLVTDGSRVTHISCPDGDVRAEAIVVAAGAASPLLTRTMGISLPIYPAKGYSVTAPVKDADRAPRLGGIDERTLVAWSPFGDQIRMSATAEFVGYDRSSTPADYAGIVAAGDELFPGVVDWDSAHYRTGLRPMTPDGPPLIGLGRHDNLYYNTGHGHIGWTMACGSARMLADLMEGRRPDLDPTPYAPVGRRRHR
ncbi:D-amino acid dehydrogenase [Mycolicibacterium litorale]|uniref:D-amino acid dehydrogenase n=1 Tax=Mycolicibacterium litorale TaxID=758802 RepID=A0AAD1MUR2_9MYCO|nr:D-amino acid dehydrogenase [Mycolicibacterium litorale]MCV7415276.1 D-amino acid dehydrogenase [Mycolicibacterium litorale]TDY08530.1 D-amino-acid dehydrogenase [Mycolicibacterium litorale]BBY16456.1 D-amino acid dehydrogenase [Mycolicibacterium litorale]